MQIGIGDKESDMRIHVTSKMHLFALQEEFNQLFPYLKVEFTASNQSKSDAGYGKLLKMTSRTLGECGIYGEQGEISIIPEMTVADLERAFRKNYGLSTLIFRKSGKAWLEATVTDQWTLEKQNLEGKLLSS